MTPEEALVKLTELGQEKKPSYEQQHLDCEAVILELLNSLGHQEIADLYSKLSLEWWYV